MSYENDGYPIEDALEESMLQEFLTASKAFADAPPADKEAARVRYRGTLARFAKLVFKQSCNLSPNLETRTFRFAIRGARGIEELK